MTGARAGAITDPIWQQQPFLLTAVPPAPPPAAEAARGLEAVYLMPDVLHTGGGYYRTCGHRLSALAGGRRRWARAAAAGLRSIDSPALLRPFFYITPAASRGDGRAVIAQNPGRN